MISLVVSSGLQAANFYISNISETTQDNAPALVIRFTEAIDPSFDLGDSILVTPPPSNDNIWIPQNQGRQWVLPFVEPSTTYTIQVLDQLTSTKGNRLEEVNDKESAFKQSLTTRKIEPGASFTGSGTFLVGSIQRAIPVTVVNQPKIDIDVFRVRDEDIGRFIDNTSYNGTKSYYNINRIRQYADLVHSARFENDAPTNQRVTYNLNLDPIVEKNIPGIYVAVLRKAGVYEYTYDTTVFTITDVGLHARKFKDSLEIYSHTISTATPLAGVELEFLWPETEVQSAYKQTATTDNKGSYRLNTNDIPNLVVARYGDSITYLALRHGELDLSAYPNVPTLHNQYQMYLYGPRDLYRPGETVSINLILRDFDGNKVPNLPIKAELFDARGERKKLFTWQADESNLYQTHFNLDENAPTGNWRLMVSIDEEYSNEYWFKVEDFLPEMLTLSFYDDQPDMTRYVPNGHFLVPIQSDYLYGAPAAHNKADAVVTVYPSTTPFPEHKEFYFGNAKQRISNRSYKTSSIKLDEQGAGNIHVVDHIPNVEVPLTYVVSASVYASGGRPVTRSQKIIQLPNFKKLVGIQPMFEKKPASNQTLPFQLISTNQQGELVDDIVKLRLTREYREYFWEYDNARGWQWNYNTHDYVVANETVSLNKDIGKIEFPVQWGHYTLEATSSLGAVTKFEFETEWSWDHQQSTNLKPDMLHMSLDKKHYSAGDLAKLRIISPSAGQGIINVESSDGVQLSLQHDIQKGDNTVPLTIAEDWNRHDLYITAMVLSPADQVSEVSPKRALGITHLSVIRPNAVAHVDLVTAEKVQPNKTVSAHIKVTNLAELGNQKLYATVALVDKGVLNITNFKTPKPEQFFYAPRRFESAYLDIYGDIINNLGYDLLEQKFGGDAFKDSDGSLTRGGNKPKSDVQIVSFLSQPIPLKNGEADVHFELPNFNGRLKWMVVVYGDHSYGSTEQETIVADKIVTQMAMPRFLSMGDTSQINLDLHNLSDQQQQLEIKLTVDGALDSPDLAQTLELADKEKQVFSIPIKAKDSEGQGVISLTITNNNEINIHRTWKLGVRSPYPWSTQVERKTILANEKWTPTPDISSLRDGTVEAMLTISNRPAINFNSHFDYLLAYPYGCLEQTTSSTYPWLLTDQEMVKQLNLTDNLKKRFDDDYSESFRLAQIHKGLESLKSKQLSNGGFGYWDSRSYESRWGSVYATELLVDARNEGIAVDEAMLNKAIKRLKYFVNNQSDDSLWSENRAYATFAYRAYAAYVLAKANAINLSYVRRLYDQATIKNKSLFSLAQTVIAKYENSGLAWMHLAGAFHLLNDASRTEQSLKFAYLFERPAHAYYRDYGSVLRDQALKLAVALETDLDDGNQSDKIINSLRNKRRLSTQERLALLKVARQFSNKESTWHASLETASGTQNIAKQQAFNAIFDGEMLEKLKSVGAKDQSLYVSLQYQGAPKQGPQPESNGLSIARQYYDLNGQVMTANRLKSGDLIIVGLEVSTTHELTIPDALVVDLLPAGLELENQNLANASVDLDGIVINQQSLGEYFRTIKMDFQEFRDDRYVAAISLKANKKTTLFYLARAVTPGKYQVSPPFVEDMYRPDYRAIGTSLDSMEVTAE